MSTTPISCTIGTSDPTAALGVEVWLDDQKMFDTEHLQDKSVDIKFEVSDDECDHVLKFILKNKTQQHTTIDDNGNIISDAVVTITNLAFDDIELNQLFFDKAVYTHNYNQTVADPVEQKFYGIMGCNGQVTLHFSGPSYMWLLKNM